MQTVDDVGVGRALRAVRLRRGLTQCELAARAGVSQATVSRIERGHLEEIPAGRLRRVAGELEIRLPYAPSWRGGELARLLDQRHAALVERTVQRLGDLGWESAIEVTFNRYGERGSIDVLGWRADRQALVVIEVKTRLVDIQDLLAGLDRKRRLAPVIAFAERGWSSRVTGAVVVLPATSTAADTVARHRAVFAAALPDRTVAVRRWLGAPDGGCRGILFVRDSHPGTRPGKGMARLARA